MLNKNLKDNIKGYSHFIYYRDNALWYRTETDLVFPVPMADIGNSMFLPMEKSLILMRWIRKYIASLDA
jgi:hypothetical protein